MPTIIVDKARGLFQKAATSANKAGTLSGHKIQTKDCGTSAITLTESDSGKVFLVGADDGAHTIQFPVVEGWHGEFMVTGSSASSTLSCGAVSLSGSVLSAGETVVPLGMFGDAADGATANVDIASNAVRIKAAAKAGTSVSLRVIKDGSGIFNVYARGLTDT